MGRIKSLSRYIQRCDGVIRYKKGKYINPIVNADGYLQCKLCKEGKYKTVKVHRIVAETFIENPNNYPEVNHKDCNRQNNCVDNLEWKSHIENVQYSADLGHYKKPHGKENWNYKGTTLKEYYAAHPEDKLKLSRPGSQNGRSRPIRMIMENAILDFDYVGECVKYLIDHDIINDVKYDSLHTRIIERLRTGKSYRGLTFFDK